MMTLVSVFAILVSASLCPVQAQFQQGSCEYPGEIETEYSNGPNGPVRRCELNPCFGGNNPCLGGGTCTPIRINVGSTLSYAFNFSTSCSCKAPYVATTVVIATVSPYSYTRGVCGSGAATDFPNRCYFNSDPLGRYVCCDRQGCNGFNDDKLTPRCANNGYVPPGFGVSGLPPNPPPPTPPSGPQDEGVCGTGSATDFPTRCYFNNDPQGRYVCCDGQGCNGFNADNLTPRCANNGFVPPGFGVSGSPANPPPSPLPSGPQGVCGTGGATDFPTRCYFNNDPQGRYVCCDRDGCEGFNPPGYLFPRCKTNGFIPLGFGV